MARIMIVDDAPVMRLRLKDIIQQQHEVVAEAENGVQAVAMYERYKPDIVTLDISMADMNGIDALTQIITKYNNAKVIMVSALGQRHLVYSALRNGAKDFIIKPFKEEAILESIRKIVEKNSRERE